jgi:hypothetical protein
VSLPEPPPLETAASRKVGEKIELNEPSVGKALGGRSHCPPFDEEHYKKTGKLSRILVSSNIPIPNSGFETEKSTL